MKRDRIFISHSHSDADFAKRLALDLNRRGVDVWLDVLDIEPGADWNSSIQDALKSSPYLLVIWSKSSVISAEVLAEVFQAKVEGKQIIQVLIDDCKPPSQFDRIQNIDFRQRYDDALQVLLNFLPIGRRTQRLKELGVIMPYNPYPTIPKMTTQ